MTGPDIDHSVPFDATSTIRNTEHRVLKGRPEMTRTARFTLDPAFKVGEVNPRLFGSFVEHLGRCVYTGIFEPDHPTADEAGRSPESPVPGRAPTAWGGGR